MREFLVWVGATIACVAVCIGLGIAIQGTDFFMYRWFAPKYEQVRRETFEQSKAYRQGMVQELQAMQFEYVKADDAHKAALASIILHRAADVPSDAMPPSLSSFVNSLRNGAAQ